jgi:threonylcarbamoyladenosine tRNA methylthiotransferase MtaB
MVGFPGETEADFEETRRMIEELPLTYLHVFTYSSRPGTRSAAMPNQVPVRVARERNRVLRELAAEKKRAFMNSFVGRELPAITLSVGDDHSTEALTDNYLKMRLAGRHAANQWLGAQVQDVRADELFGIVPWMNH